MVDMAGALQRSPAAARTALVAVWVVTRSLLLMLVTGVVPCPWPMGVADVGLFYEPWFETLRGGSFPVDDVLWQYPPGAAAVLLAPGILPFGYVTSFHVLMLLADTVVLACLLRRAGDKGGSLAGVALWAGGLPLLGPMVLARYDLAATALAVAALAAAARPRVGGVLAGVGAAVKVWPALVLAGTTPRRVRTTWAWAAGGAAVLVAGLALALPGAFGFLGNQRARGIEIESVFALPLHVATWWDWPGEVRENYGSMEFLGPGVDALRRVSLASTLVAGGWLVWWRLTARRWTASTPADAALTAVLLLTVTSRVISPQYMVWLLGLAGLCLVTRGTTQRPVAVLILLATPLTTWEFPLWFEQLMDSRPEAVAVLAVRDALLVAAAVLAAVRLRRGTREPAGQPAEVPAGADASPADPPDPAEGKPVPQTAS